MNKERLQNHAPATLAVLRNDVGQQCHEQGTHKVLS